MTILNRDPALTSREKDVARPASRGLSNKSIARELRVREGTIKVHLHNIYQKLGISNRIELILKEVGRNK